MDKKEQCSQCGQVERVTRAWYVHHRSGDRVYPVRAGAISFCLNRECPSNTEKSRKGW